MVDNAKQISWVEDQINSLGGPADWEPNVERAQQQLRLKIDDSREQKRRRRTWLTRLAFAVLILVVALPVTVAIAQVLLNNWSVLRVEPLHVNVNEELWDAFNTHFIQPPMPLRPASLDAAEAAIGFKPAHPAKLGALRPILQMIGQDPIHALSLIRSAPEFWNPPPFRQPANTNAMVSEPIVGEFTIDTARLKSALQTAGAGDVVVPQSWNGATIRITINPSVIINYDGVFFAQSKPLLIAAPSQVSLPQYVETTLRVDGLTAAEASRLREKFAANPSAFVVIPLEAQVDVEEVKLWNGSGTLFKNADGKRHSCSFCPGPSEVLFVWNTSDRLFALKGKLTKEQAISFSYSLQ